jgi:murein DD-endopeptidase MepM/ murein hydrolase activator NlpD
MAMKEKITFFVTSNSTGPIRKVTLSKRVLKFIALLISIGMAVGTGFTVDYFSLRQRHKVGSTDGFAALHPNNIQKLTYDINSIRSKLAEMSVLEEKLRLLAKVDFDAKKNLNGMGGPLPEDIDPKSEIRNRPGELLLEMRNQLVQLEQASIDREQNLETLLEILRRKQEIFERTPRGRPTPGRISSGYGWRQSPFTGKREFHRGIDIAIYKGAPVKAPANGVVTSVGNQGGLGKMIVIDHGNGVVTRYGHLNKILKKPGDRIQRGEVIARVGNTGRSSGPHLHYEMQVGGFPVNPKKFMFN